MSKRKQAAIEAGVAALAAQEKIAASAHASRWRLKLARSHFFALIGLSALLAVGVLGAAISANGNARNAEGGSNSSWLGNLFGAAPATTSANPALLPPPTPTPQLSKEYLYAGSRLLATEDAGAPNSSNQPADLVIWRLSTGVWYVRDSTDGTFTINSFGAATVDQAAPGDFDGDGLADFSVFRPDNTALTGTWYIQYNPQANTGNFITAQFGLNTDKPAPADYDGDGRADIAVWRNSNNTFYILQSSNNAFRQVVLSSFTAGESSVTPVSADYDGDGIADPAVYRGALGNALWVTKRSTDGAEIAPSWGTLSAGDVPSPGDYDGDGKADLAICRKETVGVRNRWYIMPSSTGVGYTTDVAVAMASDDKPVAGDYDGDGKTDPAVWRNSTGVWYIQKSTTNTLRSDAWGQSGDTPIAAPMRR